MERFPIRLPLYWQVMIMNNGFYGKLAASNLKKNGKIYIPYLLTCIGTVMMFYLMQFLYTNPWVKSHPSLQMIMGMGCFVVGLFAFIFLFYTNSFLMKQRKKEIGLYNILGMEKRHIGRVMAFENFYIGLMGIGFGLVCGILFSKLMLLLLGRLLDFNIGVKFYISYGSVVTTIIMFGIIFFLTLIFNLHQIHLAKPVELLQGGNVGEKEPKAKWVLALVGLACLGAGYVMALTTKSPLEALSLFFIAVILVICGTYCLFTAGSIVGLKLLRNKKNYYYKLKHFTSVSGMIYRMKQNAVGLANICILSTMVLVMISTTSCLFIGSEDALRNQIPKNIYINGYNISLHSGQKILENAKKTMDEEKVKGKDWISYCFKSLDLEKSAQGLVNASGNSSIKQRVFTKFIPLKEYNRMEGTKETLDEDELLVYSPMITYQKGEKPFANEDYQVAKQIKNLSVEEDYTASYVDLLYVIVPSEEQLYKLVGSLQEGDLSPEEIGTLYNYYLGVDVDISDKEQMALSEKIYQEIQGKYNDQNYAFSYGCVADGKEEFLSIYGGLFFLGIFLGLLFTMAMILIIYYKQISEGYDDKKRFEIMQKVGMSKKEVKQSIQSQVKTVFFLPLVTAVVHLAFAFSMIRKLLSVLSLTNVGLFIACTLITTGIYILLYGIVYRLTAKIYYRIVES